MKSVTDWLLENNQPSVRYATLTGILGHPQDDEEVRRARSEIPRRGWAADILREQLPGGYWHNYPILNRPKYVATFWKFLVLVDLGVTAENKRLTKTCQLLSNRLLKRKENFHLCMTANLARSFIIAGYDEAGRVGRALDWLVEVQKDDGGWHCFELASGTLDCWEPLSAFAALPRRRWSRKIKRSVESGAEFYLRRRLFREGSRRYPPWFRFHYPVHYYYDLLVGLEVLTSLGFGDDSRLEPALAHLRRKRGRDGRWRLDALHPDLGSLEQSNYGFVLPYEPFPAVRFGLEKPGRPSKMITLRALRVLNQVENQRGVVH